jgi:LuxR family quorum-sensing system transcriptional regulator CciR
MIMSQFQDVQAFVREANKATSLPELKNLIADVIAELGFDQYAFMHHVTGVNVPDHVIRLSNYPEYWIEAVVERGYFFDDPVHVACQRSSAGFVWSELSNIINLTDRQIHILEEWQRQGLGEGFTVPVHIPGETIGSCSMCVRTSSRFPDASLPAAHYVASFAFEAARRIVRSSLASSVDRSNLTQLTGRQLDCLVLVGRGKSDWDISRLLGISDQTVHQHVETAKKRYGVATRTQLVVRALFESQVTFTDLFD